MKNLFETVNFFISFLRRRRKLTHPLVHLKEVLDVPNRTLAPHVHRLGERDSGEQALGKKRFPMRLPTAIPSYAFNLKENVHFWLFFGVLRCYCWSTLLAVFAFIWLYFVVFG